MKRLTIVAVFLCLALPAQAHTEAEQRAWEQEWVERVKVERLTLDLLAEWLDFQSRHAPAPVVQSTSTQASTGGSNRWMGSGVEQWRTLASGYGWNVNTALCLMAKESGGNPNAQNPSSGASGLMQVLPSWAPKFGYTAGDLFNPTINLDIAYALYADGGWGHWSPWNRGECH